MREEVCVPVSVQGAEVSGPEGVRLIVPEGALKDEIEIQVAVADDVPRPPADATPRGSAYEITLPPDTVLKFPVEVVLPADGVQPGADQPVAFRWDGGSWDYLGGVVEDEGLHVHVSDFSMLQAMDINPFRKPILFLNRSMTKAYIFAWTWDTNESYRLNHAYAFTNRVGILGEQASWAVQVYPIGTYTSWCVQWEEYTEPVWDLGGGGFWSEYLGTYHQFINQAVVLDQSTPDGDYLEMERLAFTLNSPLPGVCGDGPPQGRAESPEGTYATLTAEANATAILGGANATGTAAANATATAAGPAATAPPSRPAPVQSFPVQVNGATVIVSLYGGYALEWDNPPQSFAVANTEEGDPPPGVAVRWSEGTTTWGINRILWSTGDWVETTTDLDLASIGVQVHGDSTIGWVRFTLDGVELWTGDSTSLWNSGRRYGVYVEASGFAPGTHTLRAEAVKGVEEEAGGSVPVSYFTFIPH
jgi:hypothetical protein